MRVETGAIAHFLCGDAQGCHNERLAPGGLTRGTHAQPIARRDRLRELSSCDAIPEFAGLRFSARVKSPLGQGARVPGRTAGHLQDQAGIARAQGAAVPLRR